jgi:hypothetical protein
MKLFKVFSLTIIGSSILFSSTAKGAIQYNGGTVEAPFAATSTAKVNETINKVVTEKLGAESTSDVVGIATGIGGIFVKMNNWLRETAGIDFFAILKAIGRLFVGFATFVFDLFKSSAN